LCQSSVPAGGANTGVRGQQSLISFFDEGVPKLIYIIYTSWNELQFPSMISCIYPWGISFFA
jgi:hypothetical protein